MRLFAIILIIATGAGLLWATKGEDFDLYSPVPKVFGTARAKVVNSWFPKDDGQVLAPYDVVVGAKSALLADYDSGKILFAKNPKERLPAASTIKIMTALATLENAELSDVFVVSENAARVGENSMGLTAGEKLTMEELLYGLMLVSGNDAAVTLAEGVSGSEEAFVALMNEKAKELGLSDSNFINASGLDSDGNDQFTTAFDLVTIARYVWEKYPDFGKITSTEHIYIEANDQHKAFDLYNDTNLLTTYPGVRGIKPGFTWEAGLCLVTYAENEGKHLLGIILGSDDRRGEMKELLDYGFAQYGIYVQHPGLDL